MMLVMASAILFSFITAAIFGVVSIVVYVFASIISVFRS